MGVIISSFGFTSHLSGIFSCPLITTSNYLSYSFDTPGLLVDLVLSDSFVSLIEKLPGLVFTYLSENISVPHCSPRLDIFECIANFCISESASQFTILVYRLIKSNLACSNILSSLMEGDKMHRRWIDRFLKFVSCVFFFLAM